MAIIEDASGNHGGASVSGFNRLNVSSKSNPRAFYVSRDEGRAYKASYPGTFDAGDFAAYLKNNSSERILVIDFIKATSVENSRWVLNHVTGTAASGETITPTNLNLGTGIVADVTAMAGDTAITGLTVESIIATARCQANGEVSLEVGSALILGPGDAIAMEYDTGTTGLGDVEIGFHFESASNF